MSKITRKSFEEMMKEIRSLHSQGYKARWRLRQTTSGWEARGNLRREGVRCEPCH